MKPLGKQQPRKPCPRCGREKERWRKGRGWDCRKCWQPKYRPRPRAFKPDPERARTLVRRALLDGMTHCPACKGMLTQSGRSRASVDRLVPGLPYGNEANLRILCSRCNTAKSDLTAAELRQLADWIDREMRELGDSAT